MGFFRRAKRPSSEKQKVSKERRERQRAEGKESPVRLNLDEIKELMLTDSGVDIGLKRMEAYIERPTQKLLRSLLEHGQKTEILPTYDLLTGFRYKDVESVFDEGISPEDAERFLERLNRLGILRKIFFDAALACPECGSTSLTAHSRCTKCGSHQIVKSGLIEHIPCGSIDDRDKYYKEHIYPTCPKCGAKLVEGQYRDMGLWYICKECGEKFEHPNLNLICRRCGNKFDIQMAIVREISKYSLNPKIEQEVRQNVTSLESINKLLTDLGFTVELSASAVGEKSGIQHNFSMIAKKKFGDRENIVVIDHAVGDAEVTASPLILYTYKLSEVKADLPIFVAVPRLSEVAKRIAQGYNIFVIEGIPREKEHLTMIQEEIQRRLDEKNAKEQASKVPVKPPEAVQEFETSQQWVIRGGDKVEIYRDREGKFKKSPE